MSNENEVQSWKYNFSTWSEKPNSVAGNYSTSTSPAGWALLFSSSGKWRTTGHKTFSEIPTGKKSLGRAPARQAASSLTQNVGLGRAGQAGTHSWFLSILCLQGQSTPLFQRAPIVFSAPQVPKLLQTGCQDTTALFSWDGETKAHQLSPLEANMVSCLRNVACAFFTSSNLIFTLFIQWIPLWTLSLPKIWF